ncbi:transposase [Spartinivicinus marinus]|uniref:transposase n=1 Tax=Spartinivicinus marinus TaxID=2994442 RepID=UPI00336A1F1F
MTSEIVKGKITEWISTVVESGLKCFDNFIKTLMKYKQPITNYFIRRDNSGFVEGFNNKMKVLKRRCYGLSSTKRLFQRLD